MKRYQFKLNGEIVYKNVSSENEEAFFNKYGKYNPTLTTDEPGKSQGTSLSQNNQQKNTESILEDGSLGALGSKPSYTVGKESVTRDKIKELLNDKDFIKKIMEVPGNTINVSNDDEIQELMNSAVSSYKVEKQKQQEGLKNKSFLKDHGIAPSPFGDKSISDIQSTLKNWWQGKGEFEKKTPNTYDLPLSEQFKQLNITGSDLKRSSEEAINNKFGLGLNNEQTFVETLNEIYKDQPVKFDQAVVGNDAVKVSIGNDELGFDDGYVFQLTHQSGDLVETNFMEYGIDETIAQDIVNHINYKTDDKFATKLNSTLLDAFTENQDLASYASSPEAMQKFCNQLDLYQGITEKNRINNAKLWQPISMVTGKEYVNMDGSLAIDTNGDGKPDTNFSYNYLWQNRNRLSNLIEAGEVGEIEKRQIIKHGNLDEIDKHIRRNNVAYFDIEDQELKKLGTLIELAKAGKTVDSDGNKIDIDSGEANKLLKELQGKKDKIIEENNYIDFYDKETGKFIGLNKINWIRNPENGAEMIKVDDEGNIIPGETRPATKSDDEQLIQSLADGEGNETNMTDEEWLTDLRRKEYFRMLYLSKLAHDNIDEVKYHMRWWQEIGGALIDPNNNSMDNDERQLVRAWGEGGSEDIFDLGGYSGANIGSMLMNAGPMTSFSMTRGGISYNPEDLQDRDEFTKLVGGSDIAKRFNESLENFRAYSKALDLNVNPLEADIEPYHHTLLNGLSQAWTGENLVGGSEFSKSQIADNIEHNLKPYYDIEPIRNNSYYGRGDTGWAAARSLADLSTNTVTNLTPLLAEIAVFKRLGGLKSLNRIAHGGVRKSVPYVQSINKSFTGYSNSRVYESLMHKVVVPMMVTPLEWGMSEYGGEALMGDGSGIWDGHTMHYNKETGRMEFKPLFAMTMGAAGGVFNIGSKAFHKKYIESGAKSWINGPVYNKIANNLPTVNTGVTGAKARTAVRTGGEMLGQGLTASSLLTVASAVEQVHKDYENGIFPWTDVDPNSPEGKKRWEEWKQITNFEHFVATTIGFTALGAPKVLPKTKKIFEQEAAKITTDNTVTLEYKNTLGLKDKKRREDNGWETEDITNAKKEKISQSKKNIKNAQKKIEQLQGERKLTPGGKQEIQDLNRTIEKEIANINNYNVAAKGLHNRNNVIAMQKGLNSQKKYEEYLQKSYEESLDMLSGEKTAAGLDRISKMGHNDFERFLVENGIAGKEAETHYRVMFDAIKVAGDMAKNIYKLEGKEYDRWMMDNHRLVQNQLQQMMLGNQSRENPGNKSHVDIQLKKLKERQKQLQENMDLSLSKYNKKFAKESKNWNSYLKKVIESSFKDKRYVEIPSTLDFKKQVEEDGGTWEEAMNAYISADGKRIFIDGERALKNKSLTDGIHEITHMLLFDYLKETVTRDGRKERVISERGKAVIDHMMDQLKPEDRQMVEDLVELNYKYDVVDVRPDGKLVYRAKDGKSTTTKKSKAKVSEERDYYEEYVTKLAELVHKGKIKPSVDLSQRVGKALFPVIRFFNKNAYKFDLNQADSKKAGEDLLKFVDWIGTRGLDKNVLDVGGVGSVEGKSNITKSRDINNMVPNLKTGSPEIVKTNTNISNAVIERAKQKFGENWKEVLTSDTAENKAKQKEFVKETTDLRNNIVDNNINVARYMANHPKYGGKGRFNTQLSKEDLVSPEEFFTEFRKELVELSNTWNPAKNPEIGAYLFDIIKKRYPGIMETLKGGRIADVTRSITTEDGREISIESLDNYERFESQNILEVEARKREAGRLQEEYGSYIEMSKLRNEIGIEDIHKADILRKTMIDLTSGGAKSPLGISQKDFLKSLNEATEWTHYDLLADILTPLKMEKYRKIILESIPISQLKDMQKFLPQGQVFVEALRHPTKTKWGNMREIEEFMGLHGKTEYNPTGENLLPEMKKLWDAFSRVSEENGRKQMPEFIEYNKKVKSGFPNIWRRRDIDSNVWSTWLKKEYLGKRQKVERSGTKGNNRENVLRKLSTSLTKDAIPELLADKAFIDRYMTSKGLEGQIEAKALIDQFVNKIDRNQGLQFKKDVEGMITEAQRKKLEKDRISMELTQAGAQSIKRMYDLVNKIAEVGLHNVYDLKTKSGEKLKLEDGVELTTEMKKQFKNLENSEARFVFEELVLRDKIFNHEGNVKVKEILQGVDAGRKRSIGFEQFIIDRFKEIKGLKLLTEKQTEKGDLPDVHGELFGKMFNVEVKMPNARLGSFTGGVDIRNNKISPVTTLNFDKVRDRAQVEELLKDALKGWKEIGKYYKKLSKFPGISKRDKTLLSNFNKHNSPIPEWAFKAALEAGIYNQARSTGVFTERLIEDMYRYKKHPSNYMLWLGRGLLHLGRNAHGLNTTKLTGEFYGSWGHSKSSISGETTKHEAFVTKENPLGKIDANGLVSTSLRFIPTAKQITSKNSKIDITSKQGIENFNKSIKEAEAIRQQSAAKQEQKITASKAVENIRNYIEAKNKKRGMSTFDFDDTLAFTKSGVRVTTPNPSGLPRPGRKVIFLAGGAGSGKGNVVSKLNLEKLGMKIVNQDISLEWLKKNSGLPEDMRDLTKAQKSTLGKLSAQARGIAKRKMMKFQGKGDGVVIDGTGGSVKSMEKLVKEFADKGYDVSMLFVDTSLDVALARNRARKERSLLDFIVEKNHKAVQENKPVFKEMFGERFMEINTDKLKMTDPMPKELTVKIDDFIKSYEKTRIDAEEFALRGEEILKRGGEFDFSEFNKVVEGTEGPYLQKAIERAKKYGTKDMFVLTARPMESAIAIQQFLKSQGLNIPIENITGLANSSGNAKAKWMLEKFAEGYNDMYFVDDAMPNVKAVKKVLDQLDIKSNVVQAKIQKNKDLSLEINKMLSRQSSIDFNRKISLAEARLLGKGKGKFDYFVPPSAEDFQGLLYKLLGRGRQGEADMKFFKENLLDPFAIGIRDLTITKQKMADEYSALRKKSKDIDLSKNVEGTPFNNNHAVRVFLWEKAGFEIPNISEAQKKTLVDHVNNNSKLLNYAETLSAISRLNEGYIKPSEYWEVENIASDLNTITRGQTRSGFLADWIANKNIIFSKENLNKIQSIHGKWYRESLENMLYRMETGTNRMTGTDGVSKEWTDWINGSVGATMFLNMRSAILQTISTVNFTNWAENNPIAQARAFANQPQYWKDFAFIINSPMLRQRRAGLEIDVSASELANIFETSGKNPKAVLRYILQKGFLPTRIADSFAIALGGAPYYRNRLSMYMKRGLSKAEAKERAWLDFQELAEQTQQSSRPDLISQQQAGPMGRIILAWQNTPMQMTRLMKKALSDLVNRRGSDKKNISRILYYGSIQNLWFYALQSGLGWLMFGSDQEEMIKKKELQVLNGSFDTVLRGTGVYGAAVSTIKNTYLKYRAEKNKPRWKRDQANTIIEAINLSPPIGAKARKVYSAISSYDKFDAKGVSKEIGLRIENPELYATANFIEAATNFPMARIVNKANNLEELVTGNHEWWQRAAMLGGWSRWNVGAKDEELEAAKDAAYEKGKERKKQEREEEKIKKKKEEEAEKKRKGIKTVRCSGKNSSGKRCSLTTETTAKTWKCFHHAAFKDGMDRDGDGVKEYRCTATKSNGQRCKNKTENKNKRCYAHQ